MKFIKTFTLKLMINLLKKKSKKNKNQMMDKYQKFQRMMMNLVLRMKNKNNKKIFNYNIKIHNANHLKKTME